MKKYYTIAMFRELIDDYNRLSTIYQIGIKYTLSDIKQGKYTLYANGEIVDTDRLKALTLIIKTHFYTLLDSRMEQTLCKH